MFSLKLLSTSTGNDPLVSCALTRLELPSRSTPSMLFARDLEVTIGFMMASHHGPQRGQSYLPIVSELDLDQSRFERAGRRVRLTGISTGRIGVTASSDHGQSF